MKMHPETRYKLCKFCDNCARDTPLRGVYIPHFDQISLKISVLGVYQHGKLGPTKAKPLHTESFSGTKRIASVHWRYKHHGIRTKHITVYLHSAETDNIFV